MDGHQLKLLLAVLFLLAFVVLSLVLLSQLRESLPPRQPAPPAAVLPPAVIEAPPAAEKGPATREEVRAELELYLLESGVAPSGLETRREGDVFHFRVAAPFPEADWLEELRQRMAQLSDQARVVVQAAHGEIAIDWRDQPAFRVAFHPPAAPVAPPEKKQARERIAPVPAPEPPPSFAGRARAAIIMDDLGQDTAVAKALLAIDLPVTFAILPWNDHASRVAELAHRGGRQVLLHIPMEPQGFPAVNPGRDALLVHLSAEEIRRRFAGYLERVPHAVGGNNHMGSRFTEQRAQMEVVIGAMKEAGLFFVDSVTSGASVAFDEARRAGVPAARRDRFLDNVQDVEKIAAEIRKLARQAARQGTAVGICHPYPQTLEALRREAGVFRREGVEVVPVSELLIR